MCKFFSCISNGKGDIKYFDAQQRKLMKGEILHPSMVQDTTLAYRIPILASLAFTAWIATR